MTTSRLITPLILLSASLWLAITVMGWMGMGYPAIYPSLVLLFLYGFLGAAKKGRIGLGFLIYPLLAWLAIWTVSFWLSAHYADLYEGRRPDFTILGFHPSFAWTVLTYWVGGVLTLVVGFYVRRKDWLTRAEWDAFKAEVAQPEGSEAP
jgi:hypothetical protein